MTRLLRITIETVVTQTQIVPDTMPVGVFTGDDLASVEAITAEEAKKEAASLPAGSSMTQRVLAAEVIEVH